MLTRENPAYVGIEESLVAWRVDIVLGVRMQVMMAVLGGPPENAFLRRALGEKGEDELESPAGAVSAMREVSVVARTDGEHAKPVEGDPDPNGCTCHTRPDRPEAGEVNEDERHAFRVEDVVLMRRLKTGVECSHEWPSGSNPQTSSPKRGWFATSKVRERDGRENVDGATITGAQL